MAAPASDATGLVRFALHTIALCFSIIVISPMTMVNSAHAEGTVQFLTLAQSAVQMCRASVEATGPNYHFLYVNLYKSPNYYSCYYSVDGMRYPYSFNWNPSVTCPLNSTGTTTCTCNTNFQPDATATSCVYVAACPANMSGSPCACILGGYVPNPNGAGCIEEQYTLSEPQDQTQLPDVEPGKPREVTARVTSIQTGQPKQGAVVRFRLDVDLTSGGHDHGEAHGRRSRGTITSSSCVPESGGAPDTYDCTTGPEGYTGFTFNAPDASGTHTFTATCISHACSGSKTVGINVKVDGLRPIPPSGLYALYEADGSVIGAVKDRHESNHYLTTTAANRLLAIAINYHHLYPKDPVLHVNDASLMWGGVFDIDTEADWNTPHEEHMRGTVVDIRANSRAGAISPSNFDSFMRLAKLNKVNAKIHSPGETNQHFHVRLLNRSE